MVLLTYYCFQDRMPDHKGARKFEAYPLSMTSSVFSRISGASPVYEAFAFLVDRGLFVPSSNRPIQIVDKISEEELATLLSRFHAYIGTSEKDDFFATVNHDFRYESPDVPNVGPNESAYASNLIPQKSIIEWAKGRFKEDTYSKAFYDTFIDLGPREEPTLGGLVTDINSLLAAKDIPSYVQALKDLIARTGYCPLWSEVKEVKKTMDDAGETSTWTLEFTSYDGDFAPYEVKPGSRGYTESVNRFTPIFQECLSITTAEARTYATAYTDFKYHYALNRQDNSSWEGKGVVFEPGDVFGDLDFYQFLIDIGISEPKYANFSNGASILGYLNVFKDGYLEELKGVAIWQMLEHYIPALPNKSATMAWAHPGDGSSHTLEHLTSDSYFTNYVIPEISGNLASSYYATSEYQADAQKVYTLVKSIKTKFATRIGNTSWASEEAKSKVKTKLDSLITFVSSSAEGDTPYAWVAPEYVSPEEGGTIYTNMALKEEASFAHHLTNTGKSWRLDDRKGELTAIMLEYDPLFANAFYVPWENGVVISLGYMAAYPGASAMSDAEFLASYGWVIGHEISHAFDSTGIYYDENGNRVASGWLPRADLRSFNERAAMISSLYSTYEVIPGQTKSGSLVLGEAIADLTGLRVALDIGGDVDGFSYRDFFTYGARNFGSYVSQLTYSSQLATDEHPFGRERVNPAFSVMDEFHTAFDVKEGDGMHLPPELRTLIW